MAARCEDFVMPFGKFAGKTLGDILAERPTYLDWLRDGHCGQGELAKAVNEMCEKYGAEIDRQIGED